MTPGSHVAVLADRADVGIEGRLLGLELRDTLYVLRPGPTAGFVFLFRAPLSEPTLAGQVLATGTGALHLDACRVDNGIPKQATAGRRTIRWGVDMGGSTYEKGTGAVWTTDGRWPPNVVLVHAPGCRKAGVRRIPSGVAHRTRSGGRTWGNRVKPPLPDMTYAEDDGLETASAYDCETGCPVKMLDDQSGVLTSGVGSVMNASGKGYRPNAFGAESRAPGTEMISYGDSGGASRFYPQFETEDELLAWLARLMGGGQVLRDG